jgi:four helix bundle protein
MSAAVNRIEDLIAWQQSRAMTASIYRATAVGPFSRDFGLRNQIQRASVSVMSNIAEGFERNQPTGFHQFLSVAKGSCAELRSQLYVASDVGYLASEEFCRLLAQAEEVGRVVGGLRAAVQRNIKS